MKLVKSSDDNDYMMSAGGRGRTQGQGQGGEYCSSQGAKRGRDGNK